MDEDILVVNKPASIPVILLWYKTDSNSYYDL